MVSGYQFALLPSEIVEEIFEFLPPIDILIQRPDTVCSNWYNNLKNIWKRITKSISPLNEDFTYDYELKNYCLTKKRAFLRQKFNAFTYSHTELETQEYESPADYDRISEYEIISHAENDVYLGLNKNVFLFGGSGYSLNEFRDRDHRTYTVMSFKNVSGYYFAPKSNYNLFFSYDAKYECEDSDFTNLDCTITFLDNDNKDDPNNECIATIDISVVDYMEVGNDVVNVIEGNR